MEGSKTYSNTKGEILNTIYDIIELQNGKMQISDSIRGRVFYQLTMYGYEWQLLYKIKELGNARCEVSLSVTGERKDKVRELRSEFALLDSMLEGGAGVKVRN